jgi:stage II sporulation protein P
MKWNSFARLLAEFAAGLFRAFGTVIVWCIVGIFVVVSIVSILWKLEDSPIRGLEGAASTLPSVVFIDMLGMEVRDLPRDTQASSFSSNNMAGFLAKLATGIDIGDPRSLAAQMLPGAPHGEYIMLVRGKDTRAHDYPLEIPPSPDLTQHGGGGVPPVTEEQPVPDQGSGSKPPDDNAPGPADPSSPENDPGQKPPSQPSEPSPEPSPPAADLSKKIAFVYHSHSTESYLPELNGETEPDRAYSTKDKSIAVTAVGEYLVNALGAKGIGSLHSDAPYNWKTAYSESRKTVKTVMQKNAELRFILDLHRDSARRDKTTLTHDGVTYARLWFVIGKKNPEFEQNFHFAEELNRRVEEKLPGLSRGVVGKREGSNGEFNQSLSPYSVIVEVGGVDNSLEETYRTMDIFAEAIAEMYWDNSETKKANTTPTPTSTPSATKTNAASRANPSDAASEDQG